MEKRKRIGIVDDESWVKRLKRIFVNRSYKDSLFKRVFRDKKYLLELYNALNGTSYTNESDLEVVTMEDVIFLKMKNDLSFIIGNTLNLYGHQSTVNPNMPLRAFLYFARQYEAILAQRKDSIYGTIIIKLPFPQCVIFYNGIEEIEEDSTLRLSAAFEVPEGKASEKLEPAIECKVRILNINYGHNKALAEKCKRLSEYSEFVQIARECSSREPDKGKAMRMAVDMGIERGLLPDILIPEKVGEVSMILTEFDEKKYIYSLKKASYMDGFAAAEEQMRLKYEAERNQYISENTQYKSRIADLEAQIAELKK